MYSRSTSRQQILSYFDEATCAKGESYFQGGKVLAHSFGESKVQGMVSGSAKNVYKTTVYIDTDNQEIRASSCSCPVGSDCKHAAALMTAYLSRGRKVVQTPVRVHDEREQRRPAPVTRDASPAKDLEFTFARLAAEFGDDIGLKKPSSRPETQVLPEPSKTSLRYVLPLAHWSVRPHIEIFSVTANKSGEIGKPRPFRLEQVSEFSRNPAYVTSEDLDIAILWRKLSSASSSWSDTSSGLTDPDLLRVLLTRVLKTGRCYFAGADNGPALSLGPDLKGTFCWESPKHGEQQLAIKAIDGDLTHQCLRWIIPWYVDIITGKCGQVVDLPASAKMIERLLGLRPIRDGEASAIPMILAKSGLQDIIPPPQGQAPVEVRTIKAKAQLDIHTVRLDLPFTPDENGVFPAGNKVKGAVLSITGTNAKSGIFTDESGNTYIQKVEELDEWHHAEILGQMGLMELPSYCYDSTRVPENSRVFVAQPQSWVDLSESKTFETLRAEGWEIPGTADTSIQPLDLSDADFSVDVKEGSSEWWFAMEYSVEVNGKQVPLLPLLLSAIRQMPKTKKFEDAVEALNHHGVVATALQDGTLVNLPFDRIKSFLLSLQDLLLHEPASPKQVKLSLLHVAELLQDPFLSKAKWTGAQDLRNLVESLRKLTSLEVVAPPKLFNAELRPYQQEGLSWLQFLAEQKLGGILADDMGLGKTVQLLAHICLEKENERQDGPFLVVCPTSVLPNWIAECAKFCPHLKVIAYNGANRSALKDNLKDADLVVTSYPLLARDATSLKEIHWHGIALDEAQAIKNPDTQLAKTLRTFTANHRFCLTGTPIENHLGELWSQFQFLMPGLLSDRHTFKVCVRNPIEREGKLSVKEQLCKRIKPFMLRRTKQQVASELPEKTIIVQPIVLSESQRELYETVRLAADKQVRDEITQKGFKQAQIMILDALLKLRQACCHPKLVKLKAASKATGSSKLEYLIEMLKQLTEEGRKILVFSQFTSMLDLIMVELQEAGLGYVQLRGDTKDRATPVQQFQNGDVPIFLLSLKAGGTGLNLTAADVVIHYDPWWNPAVEDQATDRAHRIGQTKKVFVYKLIAEGTIEQRMTQLQERKRMLANSIYDEGGNLNLSFSEDDLSSLLLPIEQIH